MIIDSLKLNKKEYAMLKDTDSILLIVSNSFKEEAENKLIDRRLDSFFAKKYTEKELSIILQLDQIKTQWEFEFNRNRKFNEKLNFNSFKEYESFLREINSTFLNSNSKLK